RVTITTHSRGEHLPPMTGGPSGLNVGGLAAGGVSLIKFTLEKKNTPQADVCLIREWVDFQCLPGQLLGLVELAEIDYHSGQQIIGSRVPRRELLGPSERV